MFHNPHIWNSSGCLLRSKPQPGVHHDAVFVAIDPFKMAPTSIWNTYKVNYNLQLLRMCIWISPYHTTTALIVECLEFWILVVFWEQTTVWVSARLWGCRPIHNSYHINVKHIYGVLQSSCAVDCGCACGWVLTMLLPFLSAKHLDGN